MKTYEYLKRGLLLWGSILLVLSHCPISDADEIEWEKIYLPGIQSGDFTLKRVVSGHVFCDGKGLTGVEILEDDRLLAVTNDQGYYQALITLGFLYTLTPRKTGYRFDPPTLRIPGDTNDHGQQNFTAVKLPVVTITGMVKWRNSGEVTIPFNPLPEVAVEAYLEDGSLYIRTVTGLDGQYALSVPIGWIGWVKPFRLGFDFMPEKTDYYQIDADQIKDYEAPGPGEGYRVKVLLESSLYVYPGERFMITCEGGGHAQGSKTTKLMYYHYRELLFDLPAGWTGDIIPQNEGGDLDFSFFPPSYRINDPLIEDKEYTFTLY